MMRLDNKDPKSDASERDPLQPNSAVDEFFSKMNRDFRRPKPSEEAVAAALQAIQALANDAAQQDAESSFSEPNAPEPMNCPKCGGVNAESNRFCGFCGATFDRAVPAAPGSASAPSGQHIHHHHYHHHYFPGAVASLPESSFTPAEQATLSSDGTPKAKDTGAFLRKLVESWARGYNSRRLDDLTALYRTDAVMIRGAAPIARGRTAVRNLLQAELDSGIGDVQLECTDVGILGDLACLTGTSRMLAPVAPASRQERTGKFLMLARREGQEWNLLADVWCIDPGPSRVITPKSAK
jgi:ketosteroid isomerase-like protein